MTGAAGGGPVRRAAGWPGYCLIQASRCVPSHRRKTTARSSLGSPAPRWPPGICARSRTSSPGAPVTTEPPAPPRRPVSRTAMLRLRVPAGGWSAPAARVAGAGGLLPGPPAVLPGLPPIPGSSHLRRRGAGHPPGRGRTRPSRGPARPAAAGAQRDGRADGRDGEFPCPAGPGQFSGVAGDAARHGGDPGQAGGDVSGAWPAIAGASVHRRRIPAGVEPGEPARGRPQSAHLVTETVRDQVPPVQFGVVVPAVRMFPGRASPPRSPPGAASSASRPAPATSWCTREGDNPGRHGQGADRDPLGAGRGQRPCPFPSGPAPAARPPRDPCQDPPLPPACLDPPVDLTRPSCRPCSGNWTPWRC